MKIVYCIASFSSKGGTEKVMSSKASYLAENGYEVTVVVSDQHNKDLAYPLSEKVKLIDLQITRKIKGRIKYVGFFQNLLQLRKIYDEELKKINPDIIIVLERGYEDFVIPYVLPHIPKIREYHFSRKASKSLEESLPFKLKLRAKLLRVLYEKQYKKYDAFVVLTEKDCKSWTKKNNIFVIPNVMENIVSKDFVALSNRPKNVIAVGSMVADRKGFSSMINIWSRIADNYPEWTLNIYGDGSYRIYYQEQINHLGLSHKIKLHGVTDDIQSKYETAQLFLMTSKGEGLPMVIIEAQKFGLPVVVYDCYCGPSDIIKDDLGGYLVDLNQENVFEEKLRMLLDNNVLREEKGKEALKNAQRFTFDTIMPLWMQLFKQLKND